MRNGFRVPPSTKAISIRRNDDTVVQFQVPRGCHLRRCLRALHAANRGADFQGLTDQEAEFVADMIASLSQPSETIQ